MLIFEPPTYDCIKKRFICRMYKYIANGVSALNEDQGHLDRHRPQTDGCVYSLEGYPYG